MKNEIVELTEVELAMIDGGGSATWSGLISAAGGAAVAGAIRGGIAGIAGGPAGVLSGFVGGGLLGFAIGTVGYAATTGIIDALS